MVVDDDPLLRKLVVSRLTADGFEVVQARGGVEALEYLDDAAEQPDLILLDAGMPELDGFEVLRQLSSDPKRSSIPVIMLTARRGRADVVAGLSNGARDYLTKPIMADDLMARVNWLFGNLA
ncbi:MAG: response regulator [Inquilinus sp.]|nr:response regulator [Inquilinus sp.]